MFRQQEDSSAHQCANRRAMHPRWTRYVAPGSFLAVRPPSSVWLLGGTRWADWLYASLIGACVKRGCSQICPDGKYRLLGLLLSTPPSSPDAVLLLSGSLTTGKGNRQVSSLLGYLRLTHVLSSAGAQIYSRKHRDPPRKDRTAITPRQSPRRCPRGCTQGLLQ